MKTGQYLMLAIAVTVGGVTAAVDTFAFEPEEAPMDLAEALAEASWNKTLLELLEDQVILDEDLLTEATAVPQGEQPMPVPPEPAE